MSSPMRSRSRIVKDGERSTVYQVREAARHDLYQQEMSQRASLRRPRSYDQRDYNNPNNAISKDNTNEMDPSCNKTYHRNNNSHISNNNSNSSGPSGVTGIDYTSRPVTPAQSDWSTRSLHSSEGGNASEYGNRPESFEDGTTERPSTAAAFHTDRGNTNSQDHSTSLQQQQQQQQQQQGSRYGGAHQRQRRRSQQRRDKRARQEEKQKSQGMHDQPATSWSWAKEDTVETSTSNTATEVDEGKRGEIEQEHNEDDDDDDEEEEDEEDRRPAQQWTPVVRNMLRCLSGMSSKETTLSQRLEQVQKIEFNIQELMTIMYEYNQQVGHSIKSVNKSVNKSSQRNLGRQQNMDQGISIIMDVHNKMMRGIHQVMNDVKSETRLKMASGRLCFRLVAMSTTMSTWRSTPLSNGSEERARQRRLKQILTVVRMLFLLSKDKKHDTLFQSETILHSLLELLSGEDRRDRNGKRNGTNIEDGKRNARVRLPISILVYATGSLKNCCMCDVENQKVLGLQGGIQTLTDMANAVIKNSKSKAGSGKSKSSSLTVGTDKQIIQLLVQITGILCAMCKRKQHLPQFWSCRTVPMLCSALKRFVPVDVTLLDDTKSKSKSKKQNKKPSINIELHLNCVRILSKLSLHVKGRDAMAGTSSNDSRSGSSSSGGSGGGGSPGSTSRTLECLVRLCTYSHWLKHDAMLVRTLFVLGNVTAGGGEVSNANRLDIANSDVLMPNSTERRRNTTFGSKEQDIPQQQQQEEEEEEETVTTVRRIDGMRMICTIFCDRAKDLVTSLSTKTTAASASTSSASSTRELEEVLVKAVRTLANLSLEPTLGTRLSRDDTFVSSLLSVLVATTNVEMPTKSASERSTREELMMNVVSSLSNISYYGGNSILEHGKDISRILVRLLTLGVSGSSSGTVQESKTNHTSSTGMDEFHGWLSLECARVYGNFSRTGKKLVIVVLFFNKKQKSNVLTLF